MNTDALKALTIYEQSVILLLEKILVEVKATRQILDTEAASD